MKLILIASLTLSVTAWAAAHQDPVGHPAGYKSFEQVRSMDRPQEPSHGTVFLNAPAASIKKAGEPYPYGSVLIMEWRKGGKDGEIARLDVMRKERGYGAAYGADKNGDWEYASYSPDGKLITDAAASLACAKCHLKAGAAKDFVYIGRFAPAP
jgi:cytochrome P460